MNPQRQNNEKKNKEAIIGDKLTDACRVVNWAIIFFERSAEEWRVKKVIVYSLLIFC
jgi:hypothetical protein